jgi:hypothetical protein
VLSDAEWERVAARVMHRTGLAADGDELGVRWVAVRHAADHIHIVATLARQDGTRPKIWNDFYRVREACHDAERWFGLRSTASADRTAARRVTRAETEQAVRRGWGEPARVTLRREVCTAAAGAGSEREFFARLRASGVLVRERYSTVNPGEITGYAAGLPGHRARDGGVVWYGGGKLAADLTLPKLRSRWAAALGQAPVSGEGLPAGAVRGALRTMVARAAEQAGDDAGFFARLRDAGVLVRVRFSEADPGQITGYSVALPGHAGTDRVPAWYGSGRLAAGLTLPRLRERWSGRPGGIAERSGASWFTAPERDQIYRHAARQAAAATEHIRHCAVTDPGQAADAAWAVADTLHVAARALRNPALRCAADSFDRAARAQHGRLPQCTRDGEQLRRTARMIALAGQFNGDTTLAVAALVAQFVALVDAVVELRQAQRHAAQAQAARAASGQFESVVSEVRSGASRFGRPRSPGAASAATAAQLAGSVVPTQLARPEPTTNPTDPLLARSPRPGRLPSRRAGPCR